MTDSFIPVYDLESLNDAQRQEYVKNVCKHMGVPNDINLVALTYVDDGEGPSRLVAYAKRGATENVRNNLQIDVTSLTNQMIGGSIVFTAVATSKKTGRQEISTGSKYIDGITGTALDDAIMTAQTRALRRVTLQFIGAGVLDESEVNQRKLVHTLSAPVTTTPQPTARPNNEAGKDITPVVELPAEQKQEKFEAEQAQLREEAKAQLRAKAIETLNKEAAPEEPKVKKTRKPRSPNKAKVDMGPSEIPVAAPLAAPPTEKPEAIVTSVPVTQAVAIPAQAAQSAPPVQSKPKLSQELTKPFRQRLFRLSNDYLEPNGFAPIEGMGNADKLRALAQLMFSDIVNMNDLTAEQWEKYLSTLEHKVQTEGPAATIKYIEDSIGL